MQGALRTKGHGQMPAALFKSFVREYEEGRLLRPEGPGYVLAGLALGAGKSMTGQFVNWNDEACAEFRRGQ